MVLRSLEQERMRIAYESVMCVKNKPFEEKYSSLVKKLPAMITQNGLLTTLAFLKSKGKDEHEEIIKNICEYLSNRFGEEINSYEVLIDKLLNSDMTLYLFYTQEVLSFAIWLKRIAEGELKGGDQHEG